MINEKSQNIKIKSKIKTLHLSESFCMRNCGDTVVFARRMNFVHQLAGKTPQGPGNTGLVQVPMQLFTYVHTYLRSCLHTPITLNSGNVNYQEKKT
jgi:hypothetical protein